MGYPTVMTDVQIIGIAGVLDVVPAAANQAWELTMVGSDQWAGVVPNQVPQVTISIYDGTNIANVMQGTDVRGWYRPLHLMIDNTNYVRLTNTSGVQANISYSAKLRRYSSGITGVISSLTAAVGAGAAITIQPAATMDYKIHDFASDQWVGAAPNALPNIQVDLTDGTIAARILEATETRQWEPELEAFVNNTTYLSITNAAGVAAVIGYSGELYKWVGTGLSVVKSAVSAVGAGANVDFRPAAGEEWRLTMIGSSVWVGISPLMFPNITASLFDGTSGSQVEGATNWLLNGHRPEIFLNRGHYLRVNDASGAGQNVGISAELIQMYA